MNSILELKLKNVSPVILSVEGQVTEVIGTLVFAKLPSAQVGELCKIQLQDGSGFLHAEVVGFSKTGVMLAPYGDLNGIGPGGRVFSDGKPHSIKVGPHLIGSVLDGLGRTIAGNKGGAFGEKEISVYSQSVSPLARATITKAIYTGVKAIDSLLTCAEGQRVGIFAAAGVGKSTLLGMLAKGADVDITVVALIGERGREVREFIERELGPEGMSRSIVICATSDRPSLERAKAAMVATAVAEYFRDQGKRVLLLMDSVTRYGRALREIGLAVGEPPARRGFPPSVFAALPKLLERAGMGQVGSITAFYTVLVEGDDMNEPIADETRSILDGHIVLSRKLAAANHFPAISVLQSTSRVMHAVVSKEHRFGAAKIRELLSKYDEIELLVRLGEYKQGVDTLADSALELNPKIIDFLRQDVDHRYDFAETLSWVSSFSQ